MKKLVNVLYNYIRVYKPNLEYFCITHFCNLFSQEAIWNLSNTFALQDFDPSTFKNRISFQLNIFLHRNNYIGMNSSVSIDTVTMS